MATRGVNKVILIGNVGADPETRVMPGSGNTVTNLNLATSDSWKDKNTGENTERTEWHRVVFFNRLAEIVGEYVKKGSKVYIEGRLQTRSWEQDGVKRYTTEIVANEMQMLDSRNAGSGSEHREEAYGNPQSMGQGSGSEPASKSQSKAQPDSSFDDMNDEIPF